MGVVLDEADRGVHAAPGGARERIMEAAYELFSRRGIRAVGIDAIIERAGVARMSLYRHFASKDELALAYLQLREERWTRGWVEAEIMRRATVPTDRLLAVFDIFDEWFRAEDFEGCAFINIMLESDDDPSHPITLAGRSHLANIRNILDGLAREAGVTDAEDFAYKWHMLMKGSIIAAGEGDADAALRAQQVGRLLLAHHLPAQAA